MARNDKQKPRSRVRLNFVTVDIDADNDALVETMKTVAGALARGATPTKVLSRIPTSAGSLKAQPDESGDENSDEELDAEEDSDPVETEGEVVETRPARARRPIKPPEALPLDLTSPPTWDEFSARYSAVKADAERILIAGSFMTNHRGMTEFEAGHVRTCFKAASWDQPKDYGAALRDLTRRTETLNRGSKPGFFKVSHLGEDKFRKLPTT